MRILSIFLISCLLLPVVAEARLSVSPMSSIVKPSVSSISGRPQVNISENYVLGSGDQLEAHLIVGNNALVLDYTFIINPEGKIFFPNVSEMCLSGMTLKEARKKMVQEVRDRYKERFDLSLMVSIPKIINVYVTGQIDDPGIKTVYDGTSIADILKEVGVAKGGSDLSEHVYLKRQTPEGDFTNYKLDLFSVFLGSDRTQNKLLKNGDIIAIPSIKSYVYIYGDVANSGTFGYVPGQTLSDYINIAGGPTARANLKRVTVTRQENGKPKVYDINASDIIQRGMTDKDIEIFAGDVINVPGNFFYFTDFASFANTLLLGVTLYSAFTK